MSPAAKVGDAFPEYATMNVKALKVAGRIEVLRTLTHTCRFQDLGVGRLQEIAIQVGYKSKRKPEGEPDAASLCRHLADGIVRRLKRLKVTTLATLPRCSPCF